MTFMLVTRSTLSLTTTVSLIVYEFNSVSYSFTNIYTEHAWRRASFEHTLAYHASVYTYLLETYRPDNVILYRYLKCNVVEKSNIKPICSLRGVARAPEVGGTNA
jgi:hypothetical protein